MNDTNFTIKFKGVLDHAITRKALEQDIAKLEKLIKPKRTSLGSTKDILKHNLSQKKTELSKQTKYERLRENVEKFRLKETKKLVKLGYKFEDARKKAFKRSLMSDKDMRQLEYEEMKSGKHKDAALRKAMKKRMSAGGGPGVGGIALGTALGAAVGGAAAMVAQGAFDFALGALEKKAKVSKLGAVTSRLFTKGEKSLIDQNLKDLSGFEGDLEREEFLNAAGVLRKELQFLGQNTQQNLQSAVMFAARLKSTGVVEDSSSAVTAVVEFLQGKSGPLYDIMSSFKEFTNKYNEQSKMEYNTLATSQALEYRVDQLKEVIKDWNLLGIPNYTSTTEKTKSSIKKTQEKVSELTSKALQPLLDAVLKIVEWAEGFSFKTHISDPLIESLKSFFGNINEWLKKMTMKMLKLVLPSWVYKSFFGSDDETDHSHSPLSSTDTETKLETDASIKTPG
ncbi:DUF759 family protein (plasmid) [Borrelia coriaceae]|uniref:Uncharacterized protein n=1 Tax=Borrelia coriaceae ATCC 43381 TaxID=1408429 RepID=W5SX97_9SPIR|nr:DUF759 family protein [Borrelia coriaceae]AHH11520.1 Hypothetical protein BCO_0008900 [Borrelia coriaceae ATCC 43381]UPA16908.1 DUF759 family protein [Borrelia coriaceae]